MTEKEAKLAREVAKRDERLASKKANRKDKLCASCMIWSYTFAARAIRDAKRTQNVAREEPKALAVKLKFTMMYSKHYVEISV
jgi:hypothetical protein